MTSPAAAAPRPAPGGPRIASLDGMRALSITLVLLGHIAPHGPLPLHSLTDAPFVMAPLGVTVFFVISGFLITTLLIEEQRKTGGISLSAFYLRRTLRIFPAMYVFLGVVGVLVGLGALALKPGDALYAVTYTMNFHAERAWWLGHTWSLAVEEQFYLLWPVVLATVGLRAGERVAVAAILVAPLLRVAVFYGHPPWRPLVDQAFPLVFDGLATGCLLALARERLWSDERYRRFLGSPAFALVPLAVLVVYLLTPRVGLRLLFGQTLVHVGIALAMERVIRFPDTPVGRLLNTRPLVWVGTLSYSLYLWQQLFLHAEDGRWFTQLPQSVLLSVCAACASFYLVEKPALKLRDAFMRRRRASTH